MENPKSTKIYKAQVEQAQAHADPEIRAKVAAVIQQAKVDWEKSEKWISIHKATHQALVDAGLMNVQGS